MYYNRNNLRSKLLVNLLCMKLCLYTLIYFSVHSENNGRHSIAPCDIPSRGRQLCPPRLSFAWRYTLDRNILLTNHRRLTAAVADRLPYRLGHIELLWTGKVIP